MAEELATTETKSIIGAEYASRYKDRPKDWVANLIDAEATVPVTKVVKTKSEDGTETEEVVETNKRTLDLDRLFDLARANGVDVTSLEAGRDTQGAPGRARMTVANSLRAAARKRHGLNDASGNWHDADAGFIGDHALTQNRDGSKIAPVKADAEQEPAEA